MTLPAWEEIPPEFDDRQFVVRPEPNPARQKIGRNNRSRGQRAELALERMFLAEGWTVYRQGGPNRRDMVISKGDRRYSVEVKTLQGRNLTPAFARTTWEQAVRQCGPSERPLAVVKRTESTHKATWWSVTPDGAESMFEWLRR